MSKKVWYQSVKNGISIYSNYKYIQLISIGPLTGVIVLILLLIIMQFWYRKKYWYRFRKILVSKKVLDSVSEKFGIKISIGFGIEKNWHRKKVLDSFFFSDFGFRHTLLCVFQNKKSLTEWLSITLQLHCRVLSCSQTVPRHVKTQISWYCQWVVELSMTFSILLKKSNHMQIQWHPSPRTGIRWVLSGADVRQRRNSNTEQVHLIYPSHLHCSVISMGKNEEFLGPFQYFGPNNFKS